jgi:hypothetical protein
MEPQVDAPQETQPPPLVTHETLTPSAEADLEPASAADLPLPEPPPGVQTVHLPEPREPVHQMRHTPELPNHILRIAETAEEYNRLSLSDLSQLLFDRNIYRARDRQTGEEKPVNRGTLQKWLNQARDAGLL